MSVFKKSVLCVILLLVSLTVNAQNFRFGVKAGIGGATVTNSNNSPLILPSVVIGGMVNYSISKVFSFQAEALFSKKGYKTALILTDQNGMAYYSTTYKTRLYYIEMPVLVKVRTTGESVRFFVNAGFAPALNIGANAVYNDGQQLQFKSVKNVHTVDVGIVGGLGLEFNIAKMNAFVEMRVNNGMSTIVDNSNMKNFNCLLSTGLFF